MTEFKDMKAPSYETRTGGGEDGGTAQTAASIAFTAFNVGSITKTKAEAGKLVESAKNGGFTVTKESADELIKTLREFIDRIDGMGNTLLAFNQIPPLGEHDYGKLISKHMHDAANGSQSARSVVEQLRIVLEMSLEALLRASNQYEEMEANANDVINNTTLSV